MRKLMQVLGHPMFAAAAGVWALTTAMDLLAERARAVQTEVQRATEAAAKFDAAVAHTTPAAAPEQPFAEAVNDGTPG